MRRLFFLSLALWLMAAGARAHDTWFQPGPRARDGSAPLALGTGNRFPRQEFSVGEASLQQRGCRTRESRPATLPLLTVRDTEQALVLRAPGRAARAWTSCWAQQQPFEIELPPEKVEVYLAEIRPPENVLASWADMKARGLPWRERYAKHARIELGARGTPAAAPHATGMAMDVLLEAAHEPLRAGDTARFQVLRDGHPLAGLAVALHGDASPIALWGRTGADGRVSLRVPLPGRWILRGTDLRRAEDRPDTWDSRFVTLAFSVADAP
jgi:hypothetical protein